MHIVLIQRQRGARQDASLIDVTPRAKWKSILRTVVIGAAFLVLVPLLWLLAGVVLLGLVGLGAAVFAGFVARSWWLQRKLRRAEESRVVQST